MGMGDRPDETAAAEVSLLVADDDERFRALFASLLRATTLAAVIEAEDGAEAVELARERQFDFAVLDLNMPRMDGIEAASRLRALQPALRIALQSSDPELLRERAAGLALPLFDKLEFEQVLEWIRQTRVVDQAVPAAPKLELCCALCGYGIIARRPPVHCPLCGEDSQWVAPRPIGSRPERYQERLAG